MNSKASCVGLCLLLITVQENVKFRMLRRRRTFAKFKSRRFILYCFVKFCFALRHYFYKMSNLANIYAELLRKYGDNYTITYSAPPSYLVRLVGGREAANKVILFYKEDRNARERIPTTPTKLLTKTKKSSSISELDLTGSPLKDDSIVDAIGDLSLDLHIINRNPWKPDEEYHRGEMADKMRAIICTEQFQKGDGQGSVWFLCDGSDFCHTQLLQYEFNPTHFSRGIVTYAGVLPCNLVTSQSLVRQHSMAGAGALRETFIENCYQVNPNMSLRFNWSTPAPLPLLIDLSAGNVVLNQTFRVGDCSPLTDDFMNQLRILVYIREDIVSYHNDVKLGISRDPIYRCGSGIDMDELRESINKTMTEVSGFTDVFVDGHAEFDIEGVVQQAKLRRLTDLTDKLWDLFKSKTPKLYDFSSLYKVISVSIRLCIIQGSESSLQHALPMCCAL